MILRIEDTDQNRFVPGAEQYIAESLEWCGISFDESPMQGGPHAPYRQSERSSIYKQQILRLIDAGHAYYAFDTEAELEALRSEAGKAGKTFQYDQLSRKHLKNSITLPGPEVHSLLESSVSYVIRIRIPEGERVVLNDLIRGEVTVSSSNLDDKVLFKSDGLPTYHLANVVDDYLMGITHVIRGEEWLPSAPLHVLLYRFFGWEESMPQFAHLPLILKPDGNGKLSKRDGDRLGFPVFPTEWKDPVSGEIFSGYRESGYLPGAVVNILAHLGWNPGTEEELFSMDELIRQFSLERVGKHGAKFDPEKSKWFNHQHLQKKTTAELASLLQPWLLKNDLHPPQEFIEQVLSLTRERANLLPDLWENSWYFFKRPDQYNQDVYKKIWQPATTENLRELALLFNRADPWDHDAFHACVQEFTISKGIKMGQLMNPLRLLTVGSNMGPGMADIAVLLGKEEFLHRVRTGLDMIG